MRAGDIVLVDGAERYIAVVDGDTVYACIREDGDRESYRLDECTMRRAASDEYYYSALRFWALADESDPRQPIAARQLAEFEGRAK